MTKTQRRKDKTNKNRDCVRSEVTPHEAACALAVRHLQGEVPVGQVVAGPRGGLAVDGVLHVGRRTGKRRCHGWRGGG